MVRRRDYHHEYYLARQRDPNYLIERRAHNKKWKKENREALKLVWAGVAKGVKEARDILEKEKQRAIHKVRSV